MLANLLTNALRYTPAPGSVELAVTCDECAVSFRVTDTGIGLTPDQLSHIFERFYRVEKSRSRTLGGSGIGLTIARSLAEAMGGQLTAESAGSGKGTPLSSPSRSLAYERCSLRSSRSLLDSACLP